MLDETVYETEIKIEDKKSFLNDEIVKPSKKSFHRCRKESIKKAAKKKENMSFTQEIKVEKKEEKERKKNSNLYSLWLN